MSGERGKVAGGSSRDAERTAEGGPPASLPFDRYLVTGGAGFIGSHLVDRLLARGASVTVVDSFDPFYDPAAKRRNVAGHLDNPRFRLEEADIRDEAALERAFAEARPQAVIHLAARAGVRPSVEDPSLYTAVNVMGTVNVLQAARRHQVAHLVFGSSSSVYGRNEKVPFAEEDPILAPASPYGATKAAGEALCESFSACYGLPIVALRFFTVYGPRQRPDLAIHKFARLMRRGEPLPFYGDGSAERDYTYVDDIVDGILAALGFRAFPPGRVPYRVFNLGSDRPVRLDTLVDLLAAVLGETPRLERLPDQVGDVHRTWADLTRSRRELGYDPRVPLEEGLARFARWLEREPDEG